MNGIMDQKNIPEDILFCILGYLRMYSSKKKNKCYAQTKHSLKQCKRYRNKQNDHFCSTHAKISDDSWIFFLYYMNRD